MTAQFIKFKGAVYRLAAKSVETILHELFMTYMESGNYHLVCDINEGDCLDFAEEAVEKLHAAGYDAEFRHTVWLEEAVVKRAYGLNPDDYGVDWEELDFAYHLPVHAWIEVDGKVYDAEGLNGLDHWYQLPLFRRFFQRHPDFKPVYGVV